MLEFVKGPAPDAVKADIQELFWDVTVKEAYHDDFSNAMNEDTLPAPGEEKVWLEKYMPKWRMFLDVYADLVEGRLSCPELERARSDAIRILQRLSGMTADPDDWRHLQELNARWLALPDWSEEGRVSLRRIQLLAQETGPASEQTVFGLLKDPPIGVYTTEIYEKVTRILLKEFPKQAKPYEDILLFAGRKGPLDRTMLQEMLDSPAPASVKKTARNALGQMDRIGQPLELKGAAVDGREIDVQRMKGKVVLIDFWATWCPSCLEEVPRVKILYEKFHGQGFEVIGVSLDKKLETLTAFLEKEPTPWPQQ
jgi:thiol-disulfide isomerase/thioredoxin